MYVQYLPRLAYRICTMQLMVRRWIAAFCYIGLPDLVEKTIWPRDIDPGFWRGPRDVPKEG